MVTFNVLDNGVITIDGDVFENEKRFAIINTTDYNMDNTYSFTICTKDELEEYGFEYDEIEKADELNVNEFMQTDYVGALLIRIA